MGYHDSLNAIKKAIKTEQVMVTFDGGAVTFAGKTYGHKEFLKRELRGTDLHFDRDTKTWKVSIESLYPMDKALIEEITGKEF